MDRVTDAGWMPVFVRTNGARPTIEWARVEPGFDEPFFEQSVVRAKRRPFNALFARQTSLDDLAHANDGADEVRPRGFIYHTSRAGSTLVAQMLASRADTCVVSEAQPLDAILRLRDARGDDAALRRGYRNLVAAIVRAHGGRDAIVKMHAWHVVDLPWIASVFPDVPTCFVFRDPRAILRSHRASLGPEFVAGYLPRRACDLAPEDARALEPLAHAAIVLARLARAALARADVVRFVDYAELPDAVEREILPYFGLDASPSDRERMGAIATVDTKADGRVAFRARPDGADREIDELAASYLDEPFAALTRAARAR